MEGLSTFLFKEKKFLPLINIIIIIIIIILAIILMNESSYISCFTWYLWKFLLQHENAKMASHKSNREGNDGSNQ